MRAGGSGLVWDGDLRPEGLGLTYKQGNLFINAMGSWLRESSSQEDHCCMPHSLFATQHQRRSEDTLWHWLLHDQLAAAIVR